MPAAAAAEMQLPPGFTVHVYVTGHGFDGGRVAAGIPSTSALAFDAAGTLYALALGAALPGRRGRGRVAGVPHPARRRQLTRNTEARHLYGPPLPNVQVTTTRGQELLVTTYDRERGLGVLYRVVDGRAELVAGGTPPRGTPPLLKQPEGVALDGAGNLYVADRQQGTVVRLDADRPRAGPALAHAAAPAPGGRPR